MAQLEYIDFEPQIEIVEDDSIKWVPDRLARTIVGLPQIYWNDGTPWSEANHWALTKATSTKGGHIETVGALMKHIASYASWLEDSGAGRDWRHFPTRLSERTVINFRGSLVAQRNQSLLAPSTATARMAAVIQFYRHAHIHGFIDRSAQMWRDTQVIVRYFDTVGLERAITRLSSDLSIPYKQPIGLRLEDGLMPLSNADAVRLLDLAKENGLVEIWLMLSLGLLSGARFGTIASLSVEDIEAARPDVQTPDTYRLRVGPGTSVKTKFDVAGELLIPSFLIKELLEYAYSKRRLVRQHISKGKDRGLLFLTTRGNAYRQNSFNRLMTDLRCCGINAGLHFMQNFKFHQTRATFGTWLMSVAMTVTTAKAALAFVRDAMLHKDEKTTLLYIRFVQETPVKVQVARAFTALFSGATARDWSDYPA